MLELTDNATTVIRTLVDRPELPDGAGLRIAGAEEASDRLTVSPADNPEDGDQIVENEGARVFLESAAATMLEDKVLDARVDEEGKAKFVLATQ